MNDILNFKNEEKLSLKAALFVISCVEDALETQGFCSIILAGGNTPRNCYQIMARLIKERQIPVNSLYWFFTDERWVLKNNEQSNEGTARKILLRPIKAASKQIFSWRPLSASPFVCAQHYQKLIHDFFINKNRLPDLSILGMGADGHTASLIPGAKIITGENKTSSLKKELKKQAIALYLPDKNTYRLSLTTNILNKSKNIIFLISGKNKRTAFAGVRAQNTRFPASWIKNKNLIFFITNDVLTPAS
jgi:6-phosphogluconolactonase